MAYVKKIESNSSDQEHQSSPGYVLTFTRWSNRDTTNYKNENFLNTRKPLVVINDAVQIAVNTSKGNPNPVFSCTLRAGDLNYLTAIAPGDYVIVNMLNWAQKALEIKQRALEPKPINRYDDGFKGLFKITDVRKIFKVNSNGVKEYFFAVTGKGFDEFNSLIYYNPAIVQYLEKASPVQFMSLLGDKWNENIVKKDKSNVQNLIKTVVKVAIGAGTKTATDKKDSQDQIPRYLVPSQIGSLLNKKAKVLMSDINNYYFGIWSPKASGFSNQRPEVGFCSFFQRDKEEGDNFYKTGDGNFLLQGNRSIAPQDFSNVQVWSLLNNYANTTINECYNTYRVAPDGFVYPSVIIRQKPFNNRHYLKNKKQTTNTQFLDIPRWSISPSLIISEDTGRSDSARVNFVQVFTRSLSVDPVFNQAAQIALGNFVEDSEDIKRNGLKPYIVSCNFDYPEASKELRAPEWAHLVADWVFNGHLKMNGKIQTIGIEEPISIGDNLQIDDIIYHIESVAHMFTVTPEGNKVFRTELSLSMGISEKSNKETPVYAEMDHTDSFTKRKEDWNKDRKLPGFSDTQDLPGQRENGEEVVETKQKSFTNPGNDSKGNK
jgi:hypothetical protein